jgi:hypothetical protein
MCVTQAVVHASQSLQDALEASQVSMERMRSECDFANQGMSPACARGARVCVSVCVCECVYDVDSIVGSWCIDECACQ